jgi:hypothetical protein
MIPLTLPVEERRVVVRSFWAVIAAGCGCFVWLLLRLVGTGLPWAFGLLAMIATGFLVIGNERLVRRLYHAWNRRIARPLGRVATQIVLRICHFIVFVAVSRAGSRFRFSEAASSSAWLAAQHAARTPAELLPLQTRPRWIRSYLGWAMHSGNGWAVFLIPFLCLLRMYAVEQEHGTQANIYTLF